MMAGFAPFASPPARTWAENLREYGGLSFAMGGDAGQPSLPNLLSAVRGGDDPSPLKGASVGATLPLDLVTVGQRILRPHDPAKQHLNAAITGLVVEKAVEYEVDYLVEQLKAEGVPDDAWKLATVLLGADNAIDACIEPTPENTKPEFVEEHMRALLQALHDRIPNLFVSLALMPNLTAPHAFMVANPGCREVQSLIKDASCVFDGNLAAVDRIAVAYNDVFERIAFEWDAKQLPGFTVRAQPFASKIQSDDPTELSALDCFHPSVYSHHILALGLWNNLQQPPGAKTPIPEHGSVQYLCPGEDDFLQ